MGDKCNCYRFSPRDSLSGAVAQIADYLSKHPGWNETELRAFVDGLISSAGVETFNGRSGNVTLNKDDVNNLLIANCYFAEADETIESIDVLALYKLGIRIVFTQYSSEVDGYTLAYGIEYYPATDTAKAYLFSRGSGGVGAVVSVNGKTGTVVLKAGDILMNNGDSVEDAVSNAKAIANAAYSPDNPPTYPVNSVNNKTGVVQLKVVDVSNGNSPDENAYIFIDESDDYPDVIASNSSKLGGQLPSYYASAEEVSKLKNDKLDKTATAADASKLGGVVASDYALKTDTAPDSSKLGGKAPEYYLQPRNLMDNSDFTNPVNQRGQTSYNSAVYTIDRWTKQSNAILTIADDCINIDNSANSAEEVLLQKVDSDTAAKLIGKTVTIAICTSDGTVYAKSGVVAYDVPVALIEHNGFTFQLQFFRTAMSYQVARLVIWAGANISVKWVALYEGAYTADTLPPYVPKGYAAELAECRLYYRPQQMYCLYCYSGGYAVGINFEPMRPGVIPTPVNAKAQTMTGDDIAEETNIVVTQIDRISYVANTNFAYGNYYRVYSEFSSDL